MSALNGKDILIIGARAGGYGDSIARAALAKGARVFGTSLDPQNAREKQYFADLGAILVDVPLRYSGDDRQATFQDLALIEQKPLKQKTKNTITEFEKLYTELEQVRERGYAIDNREHNEHLFCIGAPIFDSSGRVIAALSVSSLYDSKLDVEAEASLVREKAKEISMRMGWREMLTV